MVLNCQVPYRCITVWKSFLFLGGSTSQNQLLLFSGFWKIQNLLVLNATIKNSPWFRSHWCVRLRTMQRRMLIPWNSASYARLCSHHFCKKKIITGGNTSDGSDCFPCSNWRKPYCRKAKVGKALKECDFCTSSVVLWYPLLILLLPFTINNWQQ